jgi:hypothetical protein
LIPLFFTLFLISCRSAVKSNQTAGTPESEKDIYKQAIYKSYLWLDLHPAGFEDDGCLAVLEEIVSFNFLRNHTDDASEKKNYLKEIQKRVNLIALQEDFKVQPKEYTLFFTVAAICEELEIRTLDFRKIIEDQLISNPLLYSQHITSIIWITVYMEKLGYEPSIALESLMTESVLQDELNRGLLLQLVMSPINPIYVDPMTLTAYYLTHEIFALTDFGRLPPPPIITNNQAFFCRLIEETIQWSMAINHIDLLAEFIMCVKLLDLKDVPSFQQGVEFILSHQEENGTFGMTNPTLPSVYRHGILVCMMALSML